MFCWSFDDYILIFISYLPPSSSLQLLSPLCEPSWHHSIYSKSISSLYQISSIHSFIQSQSRSSDQISIWNQDLRLEARKTQLWSWKLMSEGTSEEGKVERGAHEKKISWIFSNFLKSTSLGMWMDPLSGNYFQISKW